MSDLSPHVVLAIKLLVNVRDDIIGYDQYGELANIDIRSDHALTTTEAAMFEKACDAAETSLLRITSVVRQALEISQIGEAGS